ncbi:MAG: hypothetical protein V4706_02700 [Pseudomonadota bacterium]
MRLAGAILLTLAAAAHGADDAAAVAYYTRTKAACSKVKDYQAFQTEVKGNYARLMPDTISEFLPGHTKGDNAGYVYVNPVKWAAMPPKDQIGYTDAAYMVEVCNPKTNKWPAMVIADWKSKRPIATRRGFEITGMFGN